MAITIQELIASDTISQAVDKINFNFDQLLLNGGGAPGPIGPIGPPGPIGGIGQRGSDWFEDPAPSPGTDPNTIIVSPNLLSGDFYLQGNGAVWEYNGSSWVITNVNLLGPQGPPGPDSGWKFFGNPVLGTDKNAIYPSAQLNTNQGQNKGVQTVVVGAVPTNAATIGGLPFTNAYQLTSQMELSIDSTLVSMLLHQKNSASSGIKFMGGAATPGDNFEQDDLSKLSSVGLSVDDRLMLRAPKVATVTTGPGDTLGISLITDLKGQSFEAGRNIAMYTGLDGSGTGGETSDFTISIAEANAANPPRFEVACIDAGSSALMRMGGGFVMNPIGVKTGDFYVHAQDSRIHLDRDLNLEADDDMFLTVGDNLTMTAVDDVTIVGSLITVGGNQTEEIVIQNNPLGTVGASSLQLTSGDPLAEPFGVTLSSVLAGQDKIEIRSGDDMRIGTITGDFTVISGMGSENSTLQLVSFGNGINLKSFESKSATSTNAGPIQMMVGEEIDPQISFYMRNPDGGGVRKGGILIGSRADDIAGVDDVTYKPALTVWTKMDSSGDGQSVDNILTPTIKLGNDMASPPPLGADWNFPGGAEIIGPRGTSYKIGYHTERSSKANQIALHIRSGLNSNGVNPGDVWIYNTKCTDTANSTQGEFPHGNLRLWGTGDNYINDAKTITADGTSIGLNYIDEVQNIGGNNVDGRIYLYGIKDSAFGLTSAQMYGPSEAQDYRGADPGYVGSVNVGDRYRGRQHFKVFGDWDGYAFATPFDQDITNTPAPTYTSTPTGGGSTTWFEDYDSYGYTGGRVYWTGPTIENQTFLSGSAGYMVGSRSLTTDMNINKLRPQQEGGHEAGFGFSYNWTRVGRVVQFSGTLRFIADIDGTGSGPTMGRGNKLFEWQTVEGDPQCIQVGPIPLPLSLTTVGPPAAGGPASGPTANNPNGPAEATFEGVSPCWFSGSSTTGYANPRLENNYKTSSITGMVVDALHRNGVEQNNFSRIYYEGGVSSNSTFWPISANTGYITTGSITEPINFTDRVSDGLDGDKLKFMWLCITTPRAANPDPPSSSNTSWGISNPKFFNAVGAANNKFITPSCYMFSGSYVLGNIGEI